MAQPYFESTQVLKVFPSAYRVFDGGSKFTSEKNITNLIKSLAGGKGSFTVKDENNTTTFPIVVEGYYFELDWNAVIAAAGADGNLWVKINVQQDYLLSFSTTTTLDDSNGFTALQYTTNPDSDSWFQILQDGMPANTGYISELVDDRGNWIDITQIFDITYDDSGNQIVTIKEDALNFNNKTYVENLISQYATALTDNNGTLVEEGSKTKPVYFENGVPVAMNPDENIGSDATTGIVPIWFDKTNGFKAISGTQGTSKKPVWVDSGIIKPISGTVGGTSKPIYLENGEFKEVSGSMSSAGVTTGTRNKLAYYSDDFTVKAFTSTVGSNTKDAIKPIWLNAGVPSIFSQSSGTSTKGVYINTSGQIVPMSYELKATVNNGTANKLAYYYDANTVSSYASTKGKRGLVSQGLYLNAGELVEGQQITVSTNAPGSSSGSTGDIWFQIGS